MDDPYRTGSADSENSSDNSYVQVSKDEVGRQEPSVTSGSIPSGKEDEDIYTAGGDEEQTPSSQTAFSSDPYYMESRDPDEEPKSQVRVRHGVQDVPSNEPQESSESVEKKGTVAPQAKGYLKFLNALHPIVLYIIYWKDIKLSAVILGVSLVILLTLTLNTFIHTLVLLLLSFMVVALTYIVTKVAIDSFYNKELQNPFNSYINQPLTLPEDKIVEWTKYFAKLLESEFNCLLRLLLFHKIKQSLKFGVLLWLVSFVTNCLTLMNALFLVVAILFSVPPLYDKYQDVIDKYVDQATKKAVEVFNMVKSRIPYIGNKSKED